MAQLALNTLGALLKHDRQEVAAIYLSKSLGATIRLGQAERVEGAEDGRMTVSFKPVNDEIPHNLTYPEDMIKLCNTLVGVTNKLVPASTSSLS